MSADNIVYVQRCLDGVWRAWDQGASVDPCRPTVCTIADRSREAVIVAAHDWCQNHPVEYGVVELEPEKGPPTIRDAFDLMADAHMHIFGMKNSPVRETAWAAMKTALDKAHER